ncbi:unnamed protein product [Arabidopsis thaliana]|uniref:(thale cress) hypothetical protein n=1 Tax=Arabidopsis thaliana TaxID=3702 RepID=A0A7G2DVG9_ARATH|nr:unnamed protein product [Arabidopsis thaliana]
MAEEFGSIDLLGDEDFFFDFDPSIVIDSLPAEDFLQSSPDSWIGEIENQLMNDENHQEESFVELDQQSVSDFIADLLVDYPTSDSGSVNLAADKVLTVDSPAAADDSGKENSDLVVEKKSNDSGSEIHDDADEEGDDDAVAKKRRRRVRNRDAAVRSRERKKEYVQDLEKKRVCCALVGIPAVGFPALASGSKLHLPIPLYVPHKVLPPTSRTRKAGSKRARE